MKIFWQDFQGNQPPKDAQFHWIKFNDSTYQTIDKAERITTLPDPVNSIPVRHICFIPEKDQWMNILINTKQQLQEKKFQKVVLARKRVLQAKSPIDPLAITSALVKNSQNATVFCFQSDSWAFLGATPELLLSKQKRQIQSEALAGTYRRGSCSESDRAFEKQLLEDPKPRSEITPVINYLKNLFSPLCESLSFSPIHIKKTSAVQHLHSCMQGSLKREIPLPEILTKIHPTPALCGEPKLQALSWILQNEPFSRGLYGGAIGWSYEEKSVSMVALRCCLIENSTIHIFSGAGIVEDSDPEEEWEELNQKMGLFSNIFSIENS